MSASRPFTLTASAIPVILGGIPGAKEVGVFHILYFILAVIAMVFLQISANLINDCDDYLNNVDTQNSDVSCDVVIKNLLEPNNVFKAGVVVLTAGALIGLFLSYKRGVLILIFEVIGALGSYFYTRRPFQLKYRALGIPVVFLLFGPLPVIGAYYIQVQEFSIQALYASVPVGLLTTAILHANDIRDVYNDNNAGIKTLSIVIGINAAKKLYCFFYLLSIFQLYL
jgi:1,4-dihydroxy-2-naphthoate octaprenyltransferase